MAEEVDISASPLSLFYSKPEYAKQGLLMGFGACQPEQIEQGCKKLAGVFERALSDG